MRIWDIQVHNHLISECCYDCFPPTNWHLNNSWQKYFFGATGTSQILEWLATFTAFCPILSTLSHVWHKPHFMEETLHIQLPFSVHLHLPVLLLPQHPNDAGIIQHWSLKTFDPCFHAACRPYSSTTTFTTHLCTLQMMKKNPEVTCDPSSH